MEPFVISYMYVAVTSKRPSSSRATLKMSYHFDGATEICEKSAQLESLAVIIFLARHQGMREPLGFASLIMLHVSTLCLCEGPSLQKLEYFRIGQSWPRNSKTKDSQAADVSNNAVREMSETARVETELLSHESQSKLSLGRRSLVDTVTLHPSRSFVAFSCRLACAPYFSCMLRLLHCVDDSMSCASSLRSERIKIGTQAVLPP